MMFYNGFNLLIDLIVIGITWALTYRSAWLNGYHSAHEDMYTAEDYAATFWKESDE